MLLKHDSNLITRVVINYAQSLPLMESVGPIRAINSNFEAQKKLKQK